MMFISVVGFISLLVSIGYYCGELPNAVKADFGGKCPDQYSQFLSGPCNQFWGDHIYTYGTEPLIFTVHRFWGPFVGWYSAVAAIPIYLIVMWLSWRGGKSSNSVNNDFHRIDGGDGGTDTRYV